MFIAEYEEEEEEEEGKEEEERQGLFKIPCSMKMVSGNAIFSQLVFSCRNIKIPPFTKN